MQAVNRLGRLWNSVQGWLFPVLEDELGELDAKHREFVAACEVCRPQDFMAGYLWVGNGCPPKSRLAMCKAFVAKAVWDFPTTRALIDAIRHRPVLRRLCGWETLGEVPSEATFSRAFAAFAKDELPQRIHEATVKEHCGGKLAGHVSRDSTAIEAREKATGKKPKPPKVAKKRGRRPKHEPAPPPDPTRLQQQLPRSLSENLADAAYDAGEIREMSERLGHVAIIDHNPRRGEKRQFAPAEAVRYRERSSVERVNAHLKDAHGGRHVRVRGAAKVACHLAFGIVAIAAEQLLAQLC